MAHPSSGLSMSQRIRENIPFSGGTRDFEGYKGVYPDPKWPGGANIAVNFVLNYEEGAEYSPVHGDTRSETALTEIMGRPVKLDGSRDIEIESQYEYGTRAAVWRIAKIFEAKRIQITVFAAGQALSKSPAAVQNLVSSGHEFASHGYRWIDHAALPLATEKSQIEKGIEAIKQATGHAPVGWYYGRPSISSKALVSQVYQEQGLELLYQSDSYSDELPYWTEHPIEAEKGLLIIPYTFDTNDTKFTTTPGAINPRDWLEYVKLSFDMLYREGCSGEPKMMTVGLHNRVIGRPARAWALEQLIDHMQSHDGVWFATREQIARHWVKEHPFKGPNPVDMISYKI